MRALSIRYRFRTMSIHCSAYTRESSAHITSLLYLGTMQGPTLAKRIARKCPPGVVVIQCFPHWRAAKDGSDMIEFAEGFTLEAFEQITQQLAITNPLTVLAESQAAPGAIRLARLKSNQIHRLILLQPLGLNIDAYRGTPPEILRIFKHRIRSNLAYQKNQLLRDNSLRYNHTLLGFTSLREILHGRANGQYYAGLSHDASVDLKAVAYKTVVVTGELDQLFPPKEIVATLTKHGVKLVDFVVISRIPHSPLLSNTGMCLLDTALENYSSNK